MKAYKKVIEVMSCLREEWSNDFEKVIKKIK